MKATTILLLATALFVFSACGNSEKNNKENGENTETSSGDSDNYYKYKLESGIVKSKTTTAMNMGDIYQTLYFDDHGEKSMTENISKISMMGQTMETHTKMIMKDGYMYSWNVNDKTGTKMKIDEAEMPENMDYGKMSEDMMKQMNIKKVGSGEVLGKKCDVYEMSSQGMSGKYYIWDNINMKMETNAGGMNTTVEVVELKENVNIPSSTFEIPSDVTFTEMNMTM